MHRLLYAAMLVVFMAAWSFLSGQELPFTLDTVPLTELVGQNGGAGEVYHFDGVSFFSRSDGKTADLALFYYDGEGEPLEIMRYNYSERFHLVPQVVEVPFGMYLIYGLSTTGEQATYLLDGATKAIQQVELAVRQVIQHPNRELLLIDTEEALYSFGGLNRQPTKIFEGYVDEQYRPVVLGDLLFFGANQRMYRTDGTEAGTFVIHEGAYLNGRGHCTFRGELVYATGVHGDRFPADLVFTDGTKGGTRSIALKELYTKDINSMTGQLASTTHGVILHLRKPELPFFMMVSTDGTPEGTRELRSFNFDKEYDGGSNITQPQPGPEGHFIFYVRGPNGGIYLTDGSPAGTRRIAERPRPDFDVSYDLTELDANFGGDYLFVAEVGYGGIAEIYVLPPGGVAQRVAIYRHSYGKCPVVITSHVRVGDVLYLSTGGNCSEDRKVYRLSAGQTVPEVVLDDYVLPPMLRMSGNRVAAVALHTGAPPVAMAIGPNSIDSLTIDYGEQRNFVYDALLVQGDELHYIGWQRPDGARLMAVDFAGDGLREVKKFGSWQPATDRSEDVQLFTARKRTLYVQLGNKVLGMMPGRDAAEVLTYNSLPVRATEETAGWVLLHADDTYNYDLTDGTLDNTVQISTWKRSGFTGRPTAYAGAFYGLRWLAREDEPGHSGWLLSHRLELGGQSFTTDTIPGVDGRRVWKGRGVTSYAKIGTDFYFVINGADGADRPVLYVRKEGTGKPARVTSLQVPVDHQVVELRTEAGVLRYESELYDADAGGGVAVHYLFDPANQREINLGEAYYGTYSTARIGTTLYFHDRTKIYALSEQETVPQVVYDYVEASGKEWIPEDRQHISSLTVHRDGSLLFSGGMLATEVHRLYPAQGYRHELLFERAFQQGRLGRLGSFTVVGDDLFSSLASVDSAQNRSDPMLPYRMQVYNLAASRAYPLGEQFYGGDPAAHTAIDGTIYFVAYQKGQGEQRQLYALQIAKRNRTPVGQAYTDRNTNGKQDAGEPGIAGLRIEAASGTERLTTYTDSSGNYFFRLIPGQEYTIRPRPGECYTLQSTPAFSTSSGEHGRALPHFGFRPTDLPAELTAHLVSLPTRCGFTVPFYATVVNEGCTPSGGTLRLVYPEGVTAPEDYPTTPRAVTDSTVEWEVPPLEPSASLTFQAELTMPGEERIGDTLIFSAVATSADGVMDTLTFHSTIRCAIDPNDKLVSPSRTLANYTTYDEALEYTLRFQNIGNDTAFTVRLEDSLSEHFDLATFFPLAASHTYTLQLSETGHLSVYFEDILLPDSLTNAPASNGFFSFRIRLKSDRTPPKVANSAAIYFDLNQPIQTNQVTNTLVATLDADGDGLPFYTDCDDHNPDRTASTSCKVVSNTSLVTHPGFNVYPNPSPGRYSIDLPGKTPYSLSVFDSFGKEVYAVPRAIGTQTINLSFLPAGVYALRVYDGRRNTNGSTLIIKQ